MCVFFFKQKTAYEMRISDWSSDVCSSDLTTPVVDIDLRPGGRALMLMKGPDGTDLPHEEGVFLEIVPNEKIVFTNAFKAGWIPPDPFMVVIVTFEPEASGTRYTARVRHWSEELGRASCRERVGPSV